CARSPWPRALALPAACATHPCRTVALVHALARGAGDRSNAMADISTRTIESSGLSVALRSAGRDDRPAFVLLHGWPQCARAFDSILQILGEESYLIAPDLPGIGDSRGVPASGEKAAIAPHIEHIIADTGARDVILVGHDVGGMVAFACFKSFGARLTGGVILHTVIP